MSTYLLEPDLCYDEEMSHRKDAAKGSLSCWLLASGYSCFFCLGIMFY